MKAKQIHLRRHPDSFTYCRTLRYLVAKDDHAGRPNRFTVMVLTAGDPVIVGQELPLPDVRRVIAGIEQAAFDFGLVWFGSRRSVLTFLRKRVWLKSGPAGSFPRAPTVE